MPVITTKAAGSAQGYGEFTASAPKVYIEDVFSTYLYTGNGSTQTITNGIDLSTKGGLVWLTQRNPLASGYSHQVYDSVRGLGTGLQTFSTAASNSSFASCVSSFNSTGFTLGSGSGSGNFANFPTSPNNTYVSWTFRKQPKFFDVVTWTGNGVDKRVIPHSLGSDVGAIIIKRTDTTSNWQFCINDAVNTKVLRLNTTEAAYPTTANMLDNGYASINGFYTPSNTGFALINGSTNFTQVNASGGTYVAYLFASNAGGFGLTGTDNVISCGSYTGNGSSTGPTVTLGYEPQWLMIKAADRAQDWFMFDTMRGLTATGGTEEYLLANTSDAAGSGAFGINPTATGFGVNTAGTSFNASGEKYIYIAIRRGPMKVPTSGTSVFDPNNTSVSSGSQKITTTFPVDTVITKANQNVFEDRLRGAGKLLYSTTTGAETSGTASDWQLDFNDGYEVNAADVGPIKPSYAFRRAPGFFDVVCYTGTGAQQTLTHNLTVVPELLIVKTRSLSSQNWQVWTTGFSIDQWLNLDTTGGTVTNSSVRRFPVLPTSSAFTVSSLNPVGASAATYVAYLFATCPGVSKVGTYTGTGTTKQIDCGFTGGARFILIKRTDSTGDWYVYDTARGIVAGNDPYLFLNSTAAEVTTTDYIDPYSAGFELSSTAPAGLNANGGTFVFFAVA